MAMISGSSAVVDYSFARNSDDFLDKTLLFEIFADGVLTGTCQIQRPISDDVSPRPQPPRLTDAASTGPTRDPRITSITGDDLPLQKPEPLAGNKRKRDDAVNTGEKEHIEGSKDRGSLVAPLRIDSIKVSGVILAGKSEYFRKLFMTSMRGEDIPKTFTLKISEKEVPAVEQLMEFFYTNKVTTRDPVLLIDTITAADKFWVMDAVAYCCSVLETIPMSTELAQLYLEVSSSSTNAVVNETLKDLRVAAGQFLVKVFRDIKKSEATLMTMPLSVIIAIFSSSEIIVTSEASVFMFLAKWAFKQSDNYTERLGLIKTHLLPLVRFIHVTPDALTKILSSKVAEETKTLKLIMSSLLYRSDISNSHFHVENDKSKLERRIYTEKRIRSLNGDRPFPFSVIFVELNKDDLDNLAEAPELITEKFYVASHAFHLKMKIAEEPAGSGTARFGISLAAKNMQEIRTVRTRFSFMRRTDQEYITLHAFSAQFTGSTVFGHRDVFRIPWHQFLTGDFLFDGSMYIKAEVRIVP